jgi:hypothetical protein
MALLLIEPSEGFCTHTMMVKVFYVMFFFVKIKNSWEFCGCGVKKNFYRKRGHSRLVMKEP